MNLLSIGHLPATGRPHSCQRCGTSFARRDVLKRHNQRCERGLYRFLQSTWSMLTNSGLHTRSKKRLRAAPARESHPQENGHGHGTEDALEAEQSTLQPLSDPPQPDLNSIIPEEDNFDMLQPEDFNMANGTPTIPDQLPPQSNMLPPLLVSYGITPRMAASHAASYFAHFQPFFPIIHKPTFRLVGGHDLLSAIVVAIGSLHAPSRLSGSSQHLSDRIWLQGVKYLENYASNMPPAVLSMLADTGTVPKSVYHVP